MAGSTYTYCYEGCPLDWLINNTKTLGLGEFGGVVGVDHYWTKQGMPCVDGKPQYVCATLMPVRKPHTLQDGFSL